MSWTLFGQIALLIVIFVLLKTCAMCICCKCSKDKNSTTGKCC